MSDLRKKLDEIKKQKLEELKCDTVFCDLVVREGFPKIKKELSDYLKKLKAEKFLEAEKIHFPYSWNSNLTLKEVDKPYIQKKLEDKFDCRVEVGIYSVTISPFCEKLKKNFIVEEHNIVFSDCSLTRRQAVNRMILSGDLTLNKKKSNEDDKIIISCGNDDAGDMNIPDLADEEESHRRQSITYHLHQLINENFLKNKEKTEKIYYDKQEKENLPPPPDLINNDDLIDITFFSESDEDMPELLD